MDGSSTTGMLSSLATYADSDEEIGNTPTNQATEGVAEVIINNVDDRNSIELDGKNIEEMSENASVMGKPEGGSQGGEYNMLPSEFDSDYDRDFSDEEEERRRSKGGILVSYTEPGEDHDDEAGNAESKSDAENAATDEAKPEEIEPESQEFIPEWMKGVDLSEPNSLAALLHKIKPKREEICLPPSCNKKCSLELQEKFERHHAAVRSGKDFIKLVESKTEYRNPSIYEKLIQHLHINEKGTNFPKSVFNPRGFPRTAYYDELARIQNELHAKKQQQKNNSPQTTTGFNAVQSANTTSNAASTVIYSDKVIDMKRPVGGGSGAADDAASRKTKWDMPPPSLSGSFSSTVASSTLIPASGPLKKPKIDL